MELMPFKKGHKLNIGNQYAKGMKHTDEWKRKARERMIGNTNGFTKGTESPRKGKKSKKPAWNKGKKLPQMAGENHPNWIKDRTKIKRQDRKDNPRYKSWRMEVWKRDKFSCRLKNKDCYGRIEAHHILPWRKYPELRYEINNGITVCRYHHPIREEDEIKMQKPFIEIIDSLVSYSN